MRRFSRDFLSFRGRQLVGAGFSALRATELSKRDSGGIPVIRYSVGRLARRNISDHFGERERIAWTFSEFFRHAAIIAQAKRERIAQTASDFKLTHLRRGRAGQFLGGAGVR